LKKPIYRNFFLCLTDFGLFQNQDPPVFFPEALAVKGKGKETQDGSALDDLFPAFKTP
jgi:hypothetical protein